MSFNGRTEIMSFEELNPGDHIGWHRTYGIFHHAIVSKIHHNGSIDVIHNEIRRGVVEKNIPNINSEDGTLFRFNYSNMMFSSSEVVQRAQIILRVGKSYNFFFYNCEHFATYCITGNKSSFQISRLCGRVFSRLWFHASSFVTRFTPYFDTAVEIYRGGKAWLDGYYKNLSCRDMICTTTQHVVESVICKTGAAIGAAVGGVLGVFGGCAGSIVGSAVGHALGGVIGSAARRVCSFFGFF